LQISQEDYFPLFDISILLENIHDKKYLQHIKHNVTFSFIRKKDFLAGVVEFNSSLYHQKTIERMITHFITIFTQVLFDVNLKVSQIEIMPDEEKKQLLYEFNDTETGFPQNKTIHELFEKQVEKTPGNIAVCYPIDLSDIYNQLESEKVDPGLTGKMKNCCFKKNPYIYQYNLEKEGLKILKTNRHNSVIVNNNLKSLIELFDGERNLKSVYSCIKSIRDKNIEFLIYSMDSIDLLEVTFQFNHKAEIFAIGYDRFEDFVRLVKTLYRNNLLELVGVSSGETFFYDSIWEGFGDDGRFKGENGVILENILINDKESSTAQVLLLGDTPGIPTTGLLYLGAYLRRNGIKTRCQFYDPAGTTPL